MFLNISNHSSDKWSTQQLQAARQYGNIENYPFPNVKPSATTEEVTALARTVLEYARMGEPSGTAMIQGEATLCWELTRMFHALGWNVVVATSERVVVEGENGVKTATFEFVQFRELRN
jgi:glutamate dehydrogenase/leucine dehydrogenase